MHNEHRSNHVRGIMEKAAAESAIVSSLFPAAVRDRLIMENTFDRSYNHERDHSLNNSSTESIEDTNIESVGETIGGMPIAEFYPKTTVL